MSSAVDINKQALTALTALRTMKRMVDHPYTSTGDKLEREINKHKNSIYNVVRLIENRGFRLLKGRAERLLHLEEHTGELQEFIDLIERYLSVSVSS